MNSLNEKNLNFNKNIKINFDGGDLTSDPGLFLYKEFDIDSTNFEIYGNQYGSAYNFHYSSTGYHPLLMFDGLTGI